MRLVLAVVMALAFASVQAQPTRVRGTISGFDGKVLSVKGASGAPVQIQVHEKTEIVFTQPITLADIKPGDFLGVTLRKESGARLAAYEVRRERGAAHPGRAA